MSAAWPLGELDTHIVGLIRGYACRRGFFVVSCSYRLSWEPPDLRKLSFLVRLRLFYRFWNLQLAD